MPQDHAARTERIADACAADDRVIDLVADLVDAPLDSCAAGMLDLLERHIAPAVDGFPTAALAAVRSRLGMPA